MDSNESPSSSCPSPVNWGDADGGDGGGNSQYSNQPEFAWASSSQNVEGAAARDSPIKPPRNPKEEVAEIPMAASSNRPGKAWPGKPPDGINPTRRLRKVLTYEDDGSRDLGQEMEEYLLVLDVGESSGLNGQDSPRSSDSDEDRIPSVVTDFERGKLFGYSLATASLSPETVPMTVDTCEDLWTRLNDVRVNGSVMEYVGRGKSIHDNGLAQSNAALSPENHYFEIRIINPGDNCYIAIGLARKDYPFSKHPGWNRGSIAYHADDGKIFIGSGAGTPFGPRSGFNDILGCGIVFPCNSTPKKKHPWEVDADNDTVPKSKESCSSNGCDPDQSETDVDPSCESEDDIWWDNRNQVYDEKIKVFFMRNGKLLGIKDIRIPKGGFYPTIGMMGSSEKVLVDMNPLSG